MHTENTSTHTKQQGGDQHDQIAIAAASAAWQPGHWSSLSPVTLLCVCVSVYVCLCFFFVKGLKLWEV